MAYRVNLTNDSMQYLDAEGNPLSMISTIKKEVCSHSSNSGELSLMGIRDRTPGPAKEVVDTRTHLKPPRLLHLIMSNVNMPVTHVKASIIVNSLTWDSSKTVNTMMDLIRQMHKFFGMLSRH